jgi:uncharacterized protein DUF2510
MSGPRYDLTTYVGHGSWIALLVFFGLLALRMISSSRRRQGRQGRSTPASSFTAAPPPRQAPDAVDPSAGKAGFVGIAPCWLVDPSGRHEQRYWSGSAWTEHVMDNGVPGSDPPPRATGGEPPVSPGDPDAASNDS